MRPRSSSRADTALTPRSTWLPLAEAGAGLGFVLVLLVGFLRLVVLLRSPFVPYGDDAEVEIMVRHALHGQQLVGPFSHLHYNQLGPAFFYMVSPIYGLTGQNSRGLLLGAFLINALCVVGVVLVFWRALDRKAALWGIVVIGAYVYSLSLTEFASDWIPRITEVPLLLFLVLSAALAAGRRWTVWPLALMTSYLIQTYVSVVPVVLATLLWIPAALAVRRQGRALITPARPDGAGLLWRASIVLLVVLAWLPPVIAFVTDSPGNARLIYHFFTTGHPELGPEQSVGMAINTVIDHSTLVPFGRLASSVAGSVGRVTELHPERLTAAIVGCLLSATAAVVGTRRRQPMVGSLGVVSLVAMIVAIVATHQIQGDIGDAFVVYWASVILLPGVAGAGYVLLSTWSRRSTEMARVTGVLVALTALLVCLAAAWSFLIDPLPSSDQHVIESMALVRPAIEPVAGRTIRLTTVDIGADPVAEGVALQLEKDGADVHVGGGWAEKYSPPENRTGGESIEIYVALAGQPVQPAATHGAIHLGVAGPVEIWTRALPG